MTAGKRNREQARKEHQFVQREETVVMARVPGEGPDIAGTVPGLQPLDDETSE